MTRRRKDGYRGEPSATFLHRLARLCLLPYVADGQTRNCTMELGHGGSCGPFKKGK